MIRWFRYRWRGWKYRKQDPSEIAFIESTIQPGDFALDIGAHKGAYLYWIRSRVGHTGRVIAFEPQKPLADYLGEIIRTMRWSNVVVEWKGVSSEVGECDLAIPETSSGVSPGASFEAGKTDAERCRTMRVPVIALDDYLNARAPGQRVAFIKCDVEGHELSVFKGAEQTLLRDKPVLLFECEQRHHFHRPMGDVFAYLHGLGMVGRFFAPDGELRPLAQFEPGTHQIVGRKPYCNNFVFRFSSAG